MKIRPKVPVCTDCDHVFEYRGRNPGQLGGVVVQFGEAYCTKKKKPRLLKCWHNMLRNEFDQFFTLGNRGIYIGHNSQHFIS